MRVALAAVPVFPPLGGRTIGSTSDSGSDYPGSSPGLPANFSFTDISRALASEGFQSLFCERDGAGGGRIVGGGCRSLAVEFEGFILVAEFFAGLGHEALNKGIVLIGFQEIAERGFIVARVKGDIPREIRKELLLTGIGALIENGFRVCNVPFRFCVIAATCGEAGLRVFPAKIPQVHARGLDA